MSPQENPKLHRRDPRNVRYTGARIAQDGIAFTNYVGSLTLGTDVDQDGDGDVDGHDFLQLQRENPSLIPAWETKYGTNTVGSLHSTTASVPEPTSLALLAIALASIACTRGFFPAEQSFLRRWSLPGTRRPRGYEPSVSSIPSCFLGRPSKPEPVVSSTNRVNGDDDSRFVGRHSMGIPKSHFDRRAVTPRT